jgi:Bacterial toxin 24
MKTINGSAVIHTTEHHQIWSPTRKTWVLAKNLLPGGLLQTADGRHASVVQLIRQPGHSPMLDLTVEVDHSFFVGSEVGSVLVHNVGRGVSKPFPMKGTPNGTEYRFDAVGNITNCARYDMNGNTIRRVDLVGIPHDGIATPHCFLTTKTLIHRPVRYIRGRRIRSLGPTVRPVK